MSTAQHPNASGLHGVTRMPPTRTAPPRCPGRTDAQGWERDGFTLDRPHLSPRRWPRVPLPAPDAAALLRRNLAEHAERPALRFGEQVWTHRELVAEAERFATLFRARMDPGRPPHVGVLLDNTPDYVFALCGAALSGSVIAGLNFTPRVGEHLARDIVHTDLQMVITEPRHEAQLGAALEGVDLHGGVLVSGRFVDDDDPPARGASLEQALESVAGRPRRRRRPTARSTICGSCWFTSGTSARPQGRPLYPATSPDHRQPDGHDARVGTRGRGGTSAMPLFHTNSLMSGLQARLSRWGLTSSLARRFQRVGFPARRAPLRRNVVQLHRQTG